jgi:hypothetical protein
MMGFLFKLLLGLPGLAQGLLGHLDKKADVELAGFRAAADADTAQRRDYLEASIETNRLKAAASAWWGAKLIILAAGLPAALQMAAVFLDSMPFPATRSAPGACPKPPAPYDAYQKDIVLSFFIVAPVMQLSSSAAAWLTRRR